MSGEEIMLTNNEEPNESQFENKPPKKKRLAKALLESRKGNKVLKMINIF